MTSRWIVFVAVFILSIAGIASAVFILPPPDDDLVTHEMIVVARWNPTNAVTKLEQVRRESNGLVTLVESERFTTIEVIRCIKGSITAGHCRIKIARPTEFNIELNSSAYPVTLMSGASSYHEGAVKDVSAPCLWFLNKTRSLSANETSVYPTLTTLFGVQPVWREKDFTKLMKARDNNASAQSAGTAK